jgi:hypothetical protein
LGRDQQDRAVIRFLLADLPLLAEREAEILDRQPLKVGHGHHHQLAAGVALQRLQLPPICASGRAAAIRPGPPPAGQLRRFCACAGATAASASSQANRSS